MMTSPPTTNINLNIKVGVYIKIKIRFTGVENIQSEEISSLLL